MVAVVPSPPGTRAAYDALAPTYDERVAPSAWVRERLWERLDALFPPGSRVLDATAGTGLDAAHLVERGVAVAACDISPGMLARLAVRLPGVPTLAADLNDLENHSFEGPFDGVISTFAGLNTASDLTGFARGAARWLRPGGVLFLHVLNRFPVAELFRRGRLGAALRGERVVAIAGVPVPHRLWTPRRLARSFAADFGLSRISGQALLVPADALTPLPSPADGRGGRGRSVRAMPRLLDRMGVERRLSALPLFRSLGTFFTLELVRR